MLGGEDDGLFFGMEWNGRDIAGFLFMVIVIGNG